MSLTLDSAISFRDMAWIQRRSNDFIFEYLKKNFSVNDVLARVLSSRYDSVKDIDKILKGSLKEIFPDPYSLLDMSEAVEKIIKYIEQKEKIVIFGDYDVDGITSCSTLYLFLKSIGCKDAFVYLPKRIQEGYGPNLNAFKKFVDDGVKLCLTVDCGSSSFDEIAFAVKSGMDVIVLDHHQAYDLPNNCCLINPNRFDEKFEFKDLAAVGVAFLFILAINRKIKNPLTKIDIAKFLPFVALGTVCDQVPIDHLNRVMIKKGIEILNKCLSNDEKGFAGFKKLIDLTVFSNEEKYNIKENDLAYRVGPVINAGGRVGNNPELGFRLLSEFPDFEDLAPKLLIMNKERSFIENDILESAMSKAEISLQKYKNSIVIFNESWHLGVIGIVASKVKDKFMLPTFILAQDEDMLKGSARSVKGVDLKLIIEKAKKSKIIECGGGHKMAAGFSVRKEHLDLFAKFIDEECEAFIKNISNRKTLKYDVEILCDQFNESLYNNLRILSPFGTNNPEPLILIKKARILLPKIVKKKHLFFTVRQNECLVSVPSIMFSACDYDIDLNLIRSNEFFDLVGCIDMSYYQGEQKVKFFATDIRKNK